MNLNHIQQFVLDRANEQDDAEKYWTGCLSYPSLKAFTDYVTQVQGAIELVIEGLQFQYGPEAICVRNARAHLDAIRVPEPIDPKLIRAQELAKKHTGVTYDDSDAIIQALMEALSDD
jgi:hypothetical protein